MILPPLAVRAERAFEVIEDRFHLGDGQYRESLGSDSPAFAWGHGVLLSAFVAMAQNAPSEKRRALYRTRMVRHIHTLERLYWRREGPVAGFNASAGQTTGLDRYYDDNAWFGLALYDAAEILQDRAVLTLGHRTLDYVLSGQDARGGGGLWWKEDKRESKNTCSAAPGAVLALRAARMPGARPDATTLARRLRSWLQSTLRDPVDGLYWDNINAATGAVEKTKWSYNSALPLRLEMGLAAHWRSPVYQGEAALLAEASRRRWFDPTRKLIQDDACFAHLLTEALIQASQATGEQRFRDASLATLDTLWAAVQRPDGVYPAKWALPPDADSKPGQLIAIASAARAYAYSIPSQAEARQSS
ncbi:MAG: hypothetical protein H7Z41_00085 [Cytophagales bacterium]|nr:hypothetical protein [Armatimonadota bacterium]